MMEIPLFVTGYSSNKVTASLHSYSKIYFKNATVEN